MNFVQLCRQYTPCPYPAQNKKNKNKKEKKKKRKKKNRKKRKKEKEKNPLYSAVQDVGLGQQMEKTYGQRR